MNNLDLTIQALADECAELREEVAAYRQLACAALEHAHLLTRERDRLRVEHHRLIDEFREFRARVMRQSVAA